MILEVVADWKISVNRNAVLREVISRTHAWFMETTNINRQFEPVDPRYLTTSGAGQSSVSQRRG